MIISVGSTNPTKIKAVKRVASRLFDDFKVVSIKTSSGVSDMPMSDEETINGAINRANNSLNNADYGIGIEGGVNDTSNGMFLSAWVVVTNGHKTGIACTSKILLPEKIASELRRGRELGPLMDELTGIKGVKHSSGTIGLLTNGLINRSEAFESALIAAFMQIINEDYYL